MYRIIAIAAVMAVCIIMDLVIIMTKAEENTGAQRTIKKYKNPFEPVDVWVPIAQMAIASIWLAVGAWFNHWSIVPALVWFLVAGAAWYSATQMYWGLGWHFLSGKWKE